MNSSQTCYIHEMNKQRRRKISLPSIVPLHNETQGLARLPYWDKRLNGARVVVKRRRFGTKRRSFSISKERSCLGEVNKPWFYQTNARGFGVARKRPRGPHENRCKEGKNLLGNIKNWKILAGNIKQTTALERVWESSQINKIWGKCKKKYRRQRFFHVISLVEKMTCHHSAE